MSTTPPVGEPPGHESQPLIPNHTLLHRIGAGSYGEVWLASDLLGTFRAVKIVYRRRFDSARPFEREFAGLQKFEPISRRHESQLDILHVGRDDALGCFYYVMELADDAGGKVLSSQYSVLSSPGGKSSTSMTTAPKTPLLSTDPLSTAYSPRTLRSDLARHGRLPAAECLRLGLALATALEHLHSHGLVHRDIKPSNIVFVEGQPKLADIGLVTDADATMSCVGTEGYLPPEGPGAPPADVFGLGKVLYEISTGRDRKEFPDLPRDFDKLPDAAKEELREFNAIVLKACQPRAADRYATAAALRESLEILRAGKSVRRQQTLEHQLARVKTWGVWTFAALVVAAGAVIAWQWQKSVAVRARAEVAAAGVRAAIETAQATRRQLLLNEVQMARQGARANGWFDASWEKLREVARLKVDDDARTQAAACLNGMDARLMHVFTNSGAFSLAYSPDGQWLLCAGVTDQSGRQPAHLWRFGVRRLDAALDSERPVRNENPAPLVRESGGKPPHSTAFGLTNDSSFDLRHSELESLPVIGDAVAAWQPDGTPNGTPVLFLPGPTNRFVLVEARTSNVLQEFTLEGNPFQGNENHPVLALTPDARLAAASVRGGAGVPPAGSRGVSPRVPAGGETPPEPAGGTPAPQGRFAVWDTATSRTIFQTNELASALAFSPDGRALAVGDSEGRVRVFALPEPERGLAVRSGNELEPALNSSTNSQSDPLRIANPRSVTLLAEFPSARVRINCFAFTRDPIVPLKTGPLTNAWWLAVGDAGGTIHIWRTATGEQLRTCHGSLQDVFTLAFHPDGVTLASAGRGELRFWDAATSGEAQLRISSELGSLKVVDYVRGIAFTPAGSQFAFSNEQHYDRVPFISQWRLEPHRGVQMFQGLHSLVMRVWFSPDGRWLAALASDWQLAVWELASGHLRWIFETPQGETSDNAGLTFHTNGTSLAFCGGMEAVQWNLADGRVERSWSVPLGYTDDLALDSENQLWLLRNESISVREPPFRWTLRLLDDSPTGTVRFAQQDFTEWHANKWLAVIPERSCFVVSGEESGDRFWRITCFNLTNGAALWTQQIPRGGRPFLRDPASEILIHAQTNSVLLRLLPSGRIETQLPWFYHPAPEGRVFARELDLGYRVTFGRSPDSPAMNIISDSRVSGVSETPFNHDGRRLAWGTENGFVFLAELAELRRRLKALHLDVNAP